MTRSYRCPRCSGEFDEWDEGGEQCPFCGLTRGEYETDSGELGRITQPIGLAPRRAQAAARPGEGTRRSPVSERGRSR